MKSIFKIIPRVAIILIVVFTVALVSCNKNDAPTVAEIHAVDKDGAVVPFADIVLSCTSSTVPPEPCEIYAVGQADANGVFSYCTDLPKVLQVYASSNIRDTIITGVLPDTTVTIIKDSICGETFVSIKPNETTAQTVVLYNCK